MDGQLVTHVRPPVVVGVDGGPDGERAVRFATEEARRLRTGLHLVHVHPTVVAYAAVGVPAPVLAPQLHEVAAQVLEDAVHRARDDAPDLVVSGTVRGEPRAAALVEEARDAARLVLGSRARPRLRFVGGSTTTGVAAAAHCPVLAVPPPWTPGLTGPVVVGVTDAATTGGVLEAAFAEAERRGVGLRVVHAWLPPAAYRSLAATWQQPDSFVAATEAALAELTAGHREQHPDVAVWRRVVADEPADALVEACADASLLVVGRHRSHTPLVHGLGSVARAALHSGSCPVMVVPPAPKTD